MITKKQVQDIAMKLRGKTAIANADAREYDNCIKRLLKPTKRAYHKLQQLGIDVYHPIRQNR